MAQRTDTELRVFLNGDYENQYSKLTDKSGTVFFDKTRRAVYAEGVLITSDVVDVKMDGDFLMVKKVGESTYTQLANLAIPNVFVKFTANQGLTIAEQAAARANIGVTAEDNLTSNSTTLPLAANQGKVLKGLIDKNTTKLAGIDEGAQTNRQITVNGAIVGTDANETNITITGNLIRGTNPEGGELAINLYGEYDSDKKKIIFKTDDTEDALDLFDIDATDFIKDSFVKGGSYDADKKALILTLVTGKNDDGSDKTEPVEIPVGGLIDEYTAGNGLSLSGTTFSAKLGDGLEFNTYKNITVKYNPNGGITVNAAGVALKAATNGGITVGATGAAVDWTKAPLRTVNGETIADGNVDTRPKVWSF